MNTEDTITVAEAAEIWIRECKINGLERSTLRSYRHHLDLHINPRIGDRAVSALSASDIYEFLESMLEVSSRAMTRKVLNSLRALISTALSRGIVTQNVARDVKLKRSRRMDQEKVIPTKDEIRALIRECPEKYKPLIITAIFTGMRSSELRGLAWDHVDFEQRVIRIRQRADRWNKMGKPKSRAGVRDIPMAPMVFSILTSWKEKCPVGPLNLVFPNGIGNPESHWNIYHRVFKPLMVKCGIVNGDGKPKFGIHGLRHAAASLFIEQGWSPKKIQSLIGHASINMTFDVYGHLFSDTEGDVERMAKVERDLLAA